MGQEREKDQALSELAAGRYEKARELLEAYLKLEPEDVRMRLRLADVYRRLGLDGLAVSSYLQAADGFAKKTLLVQAISCMKQILELKPDDESVHEELAELYHRRGMVYRRPEEENLIDPVAAAEQARALNPPAPAATSPSVSPTAAAPTAPSPPVGPSPTSADHSTAGSTGPHSNLDLDAPVFWGGGAAPSHEPPEILQAPLFADLSPDELTELLPRLGRSEWPAGAVVFEEGDASDSLFLISRGRVGVYTKATVGESIALAELGEGEFFGEFALLGKHLRQATIRALEDTELLEMNRGTFEDLTSERPQVLEVIKQYYTRRIRSSLQKRCLLLRSLPTTERDKVMALGEQLTLLEGAPILREGVPGERLFLIAAGEVDVVVDYGVERIRLARLGLGEFFGEVSALTGAPCTADVVAASRVDLVAFTREAAQAMAAQYPTIKLILDSVKQRRARSTVDVIHDAMARDAGGDES